MSISINAPVPMGVANKLPIGCTQTQDETPYLFRKSGGNNNANVGNRLLLNKIVGGTVAWNQLYPTINSENIRLNFTGDTLSISNGVISSTAGRQYGGFRTTTEKQFEIVSGHKYLTSFDAKAASNGVEIRYNYTLSSSGISAYYSLTTSWAEYTTIKRAGVTGKSDIAFQDTRSSGWDEIQIKNIRFHDLTAMFGSAIADYIYTLESNTAGSGIAWLKSYGFFTKPDYPYAVANLQSVKTSAHKTVLKNLVDVADYSVSMTGYYIDKALNFVPQVGVTYTLSAAVSCDVSPFSISVGVGDDLAYRADISTVANFQNGRVSITFTPTDANLKTYKKLWMRIPRFGSSKTFTASVFDIQLEFGSNATMYNAYSEHSYALDDVKLRGLLELDASNNLHYDGDEYPPDGMVKRRFNEVDLGSLAWGPTFAYGSVYRAGASLAEAVNGNRSRGIRTPMMLSTSSLTNSLDVTDAADPTAGLIGIAYNTLFVTFAEAKTYAEVKSALNGIKMLYKYKDENVTTESADPYEKMQIVSKDGTEQFVDAGERDFEMPVQHETVYPIPTFAEETFDAFPMSVEESGTTQYPMEVTSQNIVVG